MRQRRDEQIFLERRRYTYLPDVFMWRGQRYHVQQVERIWTHVAGRGPERAERRYFRVRCDHGSLDLYHDLRANIWGVRGTARPAEGLPLPRWGQMIAMADLLRARKARADC